MNFEKRNTLGLMSSLAGPAVRSLLAMCLAGAGIASAQLTPGGLDSFQTSSGAYVDLTAYGMGQPSLASNPFGTDGTDTLIQRIDGATLQLNVPATLRTQIYALSMKSTSQVNITPNGGTATMADLYVILNNSGGAIPDSQLHQPTMNPPLSPSTGTITITQTSSTGGVFDSSLTVNAALVFTVPGGNPANPPDVLQVMAAPGVSIGSTGSTWSFDTGSGGAPTMGNARITESNHMHMASFSTGGFKVNSIRNHRGPHPVIPCYTCCKVAQPVGGANAASQSQTPALQRCIASTSVQ